MLSPSDLGLSISAFRPGQLETALDIAEASERFRLLEGPTGFGKSVTAVSLPPLVGRTLIVTGTKQLQEQYLESFSHIVDIRGHANYACGTGPSVASSEANLLVKDSRERTVCKNGGKFCLFEAALHKARSADIVITNYAFWISLCRSNSSSALGQFDLLILDEGHTAVNWLTNYAKFVIKRSDFERKLPDTPLIKKEEDWISWCRSTLSSITKINPSSNRHEKTDKLKWFKQNLIDHLRYAESDKVKFIVNHSPLSVSCQPVWIDSFAEKYLFADIPNVLVMSATLPRATAGLLGIDYSDCKFFDLDSNFPVKQRPLIYVPTARNDSKSNDGHKRKIHSRIDEIIKEAKTNNLKGVIHSVSYARSQEIYKNSQYQDIMLLHTPNTREEVFREFKASEGPKVLVSPAATEGVDFPDDECRFQILPKIPFPDTRDDLLKARSDDDKLYGIHLTALTITQCVGRGNRNKDDWCYNYIIDNHWAWFRFKAKWSKWFSDSFRKRRKIPRMVPLIP
jgi:Rad3-related DNA helicase